jgi:translocation and assembly module TamB
MRPGHRILALSIGLLAGLLVAATACIWSWLGSDAGRDWLARSVAAALSTPGRQVAISGLQADPPFHFAARRIEIADTTGVWLRLDQVVFDLSTTDLLSRRLRITRASAASIAILRTPARVASTTHGIADLRLPHLPVAIDVDRVDVPQLFLGAPLLGRPVTLALAGDGGLDSGRADLHLHLARIDGAPGSASVTLELGADALGIQRLALGVVAQDPTGTLVHALAPGAGSLPFILSISGQAPLDDWHGRIVAHAGDHADLAAELTLNRLQGTTRIGLDATARPGALVSTAYRPLVGTAPHLVLHASLPDRGSASLNDLTLGLAAGHVALAAEPDGRAFRVATDFALAPFSLLSGIDLTGETQVTGRIDLHDSARHAIVDATMTRVRVASLAIARQTIHITAAGNAGAAYRLSLAGTADGIERRGRPLPPGLGTRAVWSADTTVTPGRDAITVDHAGIDTAGLHGTLVGSWSGDTGAGEIALSADDLSVPAAILARPVHGAASARAALKFHAGALDAVISGQGSGIRIDIPAIDALLGGSIAVSGRLFRNADGSIALADATASGRAVRVDASGTLSGDGKRVSGTATLDLRRLDTLSAAAGVPLSGMASITAKAEGALADPVIDARIIADGMSVAGRRLDTLTASMTTARMTTATRAPGDAALTLHVVTDALDEHLSASLSYAGPHLLVLSDLRLTGSGGEGDGDLTLDLPARRLGGRLELRSDDLSPWSGVLGTRVAGSGRLALNLVPESGERLDATARLQDLILGATASSIRVADLAATADIGALRLHPDGHAAMTLTRAQWGGATLNTVRLNAASAGDQSVGVTLGIDGRMQEPITLDAAGAVTMMNGGATLTLRALGGHLGDEIVHLRQPTDVVYRSGRLRIAGFGLDLGRGRISAAAEADPVDGRLTLAGNGIDLAPLARLGGQDEIAGTLGIDAALRGPWRRPSGHLALRLPDLKLAAATHPELPALATTINARLGDQVLKLDGRLESLRHETLTLDGTLPLVVDPRNSMPISWAGAIRLDIAGKGRLEEVASLLPLGEDQLGGGFGVDLHVGGSVSRPIAAGRIELSDGSYDNLESGLSLRHLSLALVGNQAALDLEHLDADDGAKGRLSGSGRVVLDAPGGPSLDLAMTATRLAAVRLDIANVVASGNAKITGAMLHPRIDATIGIDRADIEIPDRLPAKIPTIDVIRINSRASHEARPPPPTPPLVATLAVKISAPGQVFISGQGLTSEWQGKVSVGGTSAAPNIVGRIDAVRGSYALLGKTFTLQRGIISFTGGGKVDPTLDILAERVATDITARVDVAGTASAPGLTLSSSPPLPQDEILSRVLFGTGVGQISTLQALQLAQTAAAFTGAAPDVMSKVRGMVGLDQLTIGSDPSTTSSNAKGALGATTLNGGKYVLPGVFVGVQKGLTPSATKGQIQVTISPHVSVDGSIGAGSTSSSLGLAYHLDY